MGGRGSSGIVLSGGLPALMGSEKQIAWATSIRENALGQLDKMKRDVDTAVKNFRGGKIDKTDPGFAERAAENMFKYSARDVITVKKNTIEWFKRNASASSVIDKRFDLSERELKSKVQQERHNRRKRDGTLPEREKNKYWR